MGEREGDEGKQKQEKRENIRAHIDLLQPAGRSFEEESWIFRSRLITSADKLSFISFSDLFKAQLGYGQDIKQSDEAR